MRILYLNDTSMSGRYNHLGCFAVQDAHDRMLSSRHEIVHRLSSYDLLKPDEALVKEYVHDVDAVVANGEGTIHHGRGIGILTTINFAQSLGKKTYVINAVLEDIQPWQVEVLKRCDDVVLRESNSYNYAKSLGIKCKMEFDSCVSAGWASYSDDESMKDKILVTDCHPAMSGSRMVQEEALKLPNSTFYPLEFKEMHTAKNKWKYAVAEFKSAKLVVSGRHHGIYMSALAGTPFVATTSNTWKVEGLIDVFGEPVPIVKSREDLEDAIKFSLDNSNMYDRIRRKLIQRNLRTFEVINNEE